MPREVVVFDGDSDVILIVLASKILRVDGIISRIKRSVILCIFPSSKSSFVSFFVCRLTL